MARTRDSTRVLLLDDEPEYLGWVQEYLESKGLEVVLARTLAEARNLIAEGVFRLLLIDMNVPDAGAIEPGMRERTPLVDTYPGLALAIEARNRHGYGGHSVIAYTVHDDAAVDAELTKLGAKYVLKARPEVLKRVIQSYLPPTRLD